MENARCSAALGMTAIRFLALRHSLAAGESNGEGAGVIHPHHDPPIGNCAATCCTPIIIAGDGRILEKDFFVIERTISRRAQITRIDNETVSDDRGNRPVKMQDSFLSITAGEPASAPPSGH